MAIHIITDTGSFHFFKRSLDDAGNPIYNKCVVVGWAVDDETMEPQPVIFPPLQDAETLVYQSESGYQEVG